MKLLPAMRQDLAAAHEWYEREERGLGARFARSVDRVIGLLEREGGRHRIVARRTRRGLVGRYPYFLLFLIEEDGIVVTGLFHMRRDPASWASRVHEPSPAYVAAA